VNSCLYEGAVHHRRSAPVEHAFRYPLFMVYLDLAELDRVFRGRWLWSTSRPAPARFRREDHLRDVGDPSLPLDQAVRKRVCEELGEAPDGPIRLLTHLRYWGYGFNPVSFFYCHDADETLRAVVAEVSNTPWNERHVYVLPVTDDGPVHHFESAKEFHVSPFLGMDQRYLWDLREPGERLTARIRNQGPDGEPLHDAVLSLERRPIDGRSLARVLLAYPWMTARVIAAIYWQASRLRRKSVPVHPHPGERVQAAQEMR
jgi:DUF1365 family protein